MIPSSIKVSFEDILKGYYDPNIVCNMKFDEVVRLTDENRYGQKAISVLKNRDSKGTKVLSCLRDSVGDYKVD